MGLESIEKGAQVLMVVAVVGVALVIILGISYINYANNSSQLRTQLGYTTQANAIVANYTTNAGAVANTAGSNVNYVYYILFAALVIGLIIAVLVGVVKTRQV